MSEVNNKNVVPSSSSSPALESEKRKQQKLKGPWGKLLSQDSQNPDLDLCDPNFMIGRSKSCNLCIDEPSISGVLCMLKYTVHKGAEVHVRGNDGSVKLNGERLKKNDVVSIEGGDEFVISSLGHHTYIFKLLTYEDIAAPPLPTSLSRAENQMVKGKAAAKQVGAGKTEENQVVGGKDELSESEEGSDYGEESEEESDYSEDSEESEEESDTSQSQTPNDVPDGSDSDAEEQVKYQTMKEDLKNGMVDGKKTLVSFDDFPYYLSKKTKSRLIESTFVHLKRNEFTKYTKEFPNLGPRILMSGPQGSEIYQEMLVKALANHFDAKLLIFDSSSMLTGSSTKDGEKMDKLVLSVLFQVLTSESKNSPLILFMKDVEKSFIDNSCIYTALQRELEKLAERIIVIGSYTKIDNSKEKNIEKQLFDLFQNRVMVEMPKDEALVNLKLMLERDVEMLKVKTNLQHIETLLSRNNLDCDGIGTICIKDQDFTNKCAENIVEMALIYHLMNEPKPSKNKDGKLIISIERVLLQRTDMKRGF